MRVPNTRASGGACLASRAAFAEPPQVGQPLPPIRMTLPNGDVLRSEHPAVDRRLSQALGREVSLISVAPLNPSREADRTPVDGSASGEVIRQEALALAAPAGTFFDYAPLHVLTTATLDQLRELHPTGRLEPRRFRPNIVIASLASARGFVENTWLGRPLHIGDAVHLQVIDPTPRCVVITLEQDGLPRDVDLLRTVTHHNMAASVTLQPGVVMSAVAGVYADVLRGGSLQRGETAWLMGN